MNIEYIELEVILYIIIYYKNIILFREKYKMAPQTTLKVLIGIK
jgi:hypothetical protein